MCQSAIDRTEMPNQSDCCYVVEIPVNDSVAMESFSKTYAKVMDEHVLYVKAEGERLGVSFGVASDIVSFRARTWWTQEKEDFLIQSAKNGNVIKYSVEWNDEEWIGKGMNKDV